MKTFEQKIQQNPTVRYWRKKLPSLRQLVLGTIGVAAFGYLFVSLLSYNPADPAWSHVSSETSVTNVGGAMGAWISDILRTFFGWAAWLCVLFLAYELLRLIGFRTKVMWPIRLLAYGSLMSSVAALVALGVSLHNETLAPVIGGVFGFEMQSALRAVIGQAGTAAFFLLFTMIVAGLTFEIRWRSVFVWFWQWLLPSRQKSADKQDATDVLLLDECDEEEQDAEAVVHQPHDHRGAFESFVKHSGVQDDLKAILANEAQGETKPANESRFSQIARQAISKSFLGGRSQADTAKTATAEPAIADDTPSTSQNQTVAKSITKSATKPAPAQTNTHDDADDVITAKVDPSASANPAFDMTYSDKADADFADESWVDDDWQDSDWQDDMADQHATKPIARAHTQAHSADDINDFAIDDVDEDDELSAAEPAKPKSRAMDTLSYRLSLTPIPELDLLDLPEYDNKPVVSEAELAQASELLEIKLQEFNIKANVISAMVGPVVTRFEVDLAPGVKASRVSRVAQDLARSMSKASLRVVEVIPGKPYIGIEVPNKEREMVRLIELLDTPDFRDPDKQIAIAVGKDIGGKPVIADLAKAPHMLVAGTTGSGKSVLVNSFLLSMLLKYTPDELKLVLIDPKQLELANYGDIPHLLTPVITDMKDAVAALTWCVNEMERRYQLMSKLRVRKISEFNKKVENAERAGEPIYDPLWQINDSVSQSKPPKLKPLPTIVIVADEFADMIMQLGKTAEEPIVRLAQKARAAGIHLLLATQRPTVNVVTGLIKANVPARVALRVNSKVDSRTIIEEGGAEDMLGHGDMMFIGPGKNNPERMHGAYVDDDEVNRVCDAWRERGAPDYIDLSDSYTFEGEGSGEMGSGGVGADELYEAAAAFVVETRKPSISAVQRKFSVGYNRAARLLDQMEERGLVSAMDHSGKRQLLL
ncbi:DNA translocase FtsK 4TM domain-containing protein [Moraxella sp. FZFQ2102]|uniref:DNA translocase FtsK 4TM domain-containing protein n=1 Tax=Moraxella sp. FZFQ2102 TaxID=2953752 RepID=UPI003532460F